MGDQGGRWIPVTLPDGTVRQDWVPDDQPGSPDGSPGEWHVVPEEAGGHRWEWCAKPAPTLPPAPPSLPVRQQPETYRPPTDHGPPSSSPPGGSGWAPGPGATAQWGPGSPAGSRGFVDPAQYAEAPLPQRKRALALAIQHEVTYGARVESQTDDTAVLVRGKKPDHKLHLLITFLTCGAWAMVWLLLVMVQKESRTMLLVDPYGNVLRTTR
jgi:hypothetical protein